MREGQRVRVIGAVGRTDEVAVAWRVVLGALEEAGALVGELHAVEVEHEAVGAHDALHDRGRRAHGVLLVLLQRLRARVHAKFWYREPALVQLARADSSLSGHAQPLDVTMLELEGLVVAVPSASTRQ